MLRFPFGGVVWNRPTAVIVERNGRTERVRIVDLTRVIQVSLWASALLAWFVARRKFA
jgi:hypothetical protein